jgi:ABC-type branched-subunit amino acid transport system substrate-binding protein
VGMVAASCGNASDKASTTTSAATTKTTPGTVAKPGSFPANNSPGVSATEIDVGGVASVTNPLGGGYGAAFDGVQAYFNMINSEGGIYGRKLVLNQKVDDNAVNNKSAVDGLIADNIFAVLPVATLLFSGAQDLVSKNIPTFGWTINPEWQGTAADPRLNLYGQTGSYLGFTDASPVIPWEAEQAHAHKVGVLAYGVPQSAECAQGVKNSFDKYGKAADATVVYNNQTLSFGDKNLAVEVGAMKAKGVDFVTTCMDTNGVVTLATEMDKQGLEAKQAMPDAYNSTFLAQYGDLFDGSFVRTDFATFELPPAQQPAGLKNFLKWMKDAGKTPDENSASAWVNADTFVAGLKAAGPNFTRQSVIDAINKMTAYNADGMVSPVDWTKAHTQTSGTFCQFISVIKDKKFVPSYTKPGKPFVCIVSTGGKLTTTYQ